MLKIKLVKVMVVKNNNIDKFVIKMDVIMKVNMKINIE